MKRDVLMLAGALLAGLVGGAVSHQLFTTTTGVSGYAQQERVIRAERFELVGRDGKTQAVLGERTFDDPPDKGDYPFPGLFWVDEEGKTRAVFGVGAYGPSLSLNDSKRGMAWLSMTADGPNFVLSGKGGASSLSVGADGPRFSLSQSFSSIFTASRKGGPLLGVAAVLGVDANGSGLYLSGPGFVPKKTGSVTLQAETDGPSLSFADKDDKTRAVLGSTQLKDSRTGSVQIRPPSSLVLFGEQGYTIWQAP